MSTTLKSLRYPAIPLITHDPYFSLWSFSDKLTDGWTKHWTGAGQSMSGMLRVDRETFRFCGGYNAVPAAEQLSVEVLPTRTVYQFLAGNIELTLTFMSPLLPHDLDVMSRPVSYVTFAVKSRDGKAHEVKLYFDLDASVCVDNGSQQVTWGRLRLGDLQLLTASALEQRPLNGSGDNLRIDWGTAYMALPSGASDGVIALNKNSRSAFVQTGKLPANDEFSMPRRVSDQWLTLASSFDMGKVQELKSGHLMIAYNDIWSLEYLEYKRPGYWRRNGMTFSELLQTADREYETLKQQCEKYDNMLIEACRDAGGEKYAAICALSFRQAISAHKLVADRDGRPLFFSKENFSNGCIATVDVTYPSAPLFLLTQPELVKGMMIPIMDYAMSNRWKFPFAPHDLGTYPLANGQVYGGGEYDEENQMPVEECGNMLLLAGALFILNGETDFTRQYWPLLSKWAAYLKDKGYDPEKQLCTDDFAGHLAHNTNLSLKAILALGAYAKMAEALEHRETASEYRREASAFAAKWEKEAKDRDHFRLAFDQPGSWSQKYNLVWDRLLGLKLFSPEVATMETSYYRRIQNRIGLPLDNRSDYTKLDWITWTAVLTGKQEDFEALVNPVFDWLNETPTRVPMCDWYHTDDGRQAGFQARSVVGGVFLKLLENQETIRQWQPSEVIRRCK